MEIKQEKVRITYDEMHRVRKMSKEKMEQYLTEVMQAGYRQGYTDSETETDEELRLAKEDGVTELRLALEENNHKWQRAVRNTLILMKGIRGKQREQLIQYLKMELEREDICRK